MRGRCLWADWMGTATGLGGMVDDRKNREGVCRTEWDLCKDENG